MTFAIITAIKVVAVIIAVIANEERKMIKKVESFIDNN